MYVCEGYVFIVDNAMYWISVFVLGDVQGWFFKRVGMLYIMNVYIINVLYGLSLLLKRSGLKMDHDVSHLIPLL